MDHQYVLDWVNQIREQRGMVTLAELPKGRPAKGTDCPIARALTVDDHSVSTARANTVDFAGDTVIYHPEGIVQFIKDFDAGLHPDLIEAL